jgi:hypothetical protein
VKRRSTFTTTVLSFLSLTTTPCRIRFGIVSLSLTSRRASRGIVLMRAMSRRTSRTRAVFSSWPVAFWKRRLNCSFFSFRSSSLSWSGSGRGRLRFHLHHRSLPSVSPRRATKRVLIGSLAAPSAALRAHVVRRHAVDLEQDAARLDAAAQYSGALALEPMRTSAGFFDTGTSGNTRIQTRPALHVRVIARRAASIWRAVTRSGSRAFRPKAPKSACAALGGAVDAALEGLAELCALRLQHGSYSIPKPRRRGRVAARRTAIRRLPARFLLLVLRHRIVLQDFALEDPDLDAACAVGRLGFGDVP